MHLDELLGDAEAEAGAPELARDRRVDLEELLEHVLELRLRDADAGVGHAVDELVSDQADADLDLALPRELDRVAGQVHEALRDPPVVAVGDRQVVRDVDHEGEPLFRGERAQGRVHDVDDLPHRVVVEREVHAPGLDLREVQHVVDQAQQVSSVHLDVGERLPEHVRNVAVEAVLEHLGEAEDRVHRRAQLVAHVGEELGLRLARLRELLVQAAELRRGAPLLGVEAVELLAHVVHSLGERAELVAIGDP